MKILVSKLFGLFEKKMHDILKYFKYETYKWNGGFYKIT